MKINRNFIKPVFILSVCLSIIACSAQNGRELNSASLNSSATNSASLGSSAEKRQSMTNSAVLVASAHQSDAAVTTTAKGENLNWRLVGGATQKLSDLKGQVVVLDFWATYCPPCEEEIPHLVELSREHADQKLQVIGLHVGGPEDRANIADFVTKYKMTYSLGYPQPALMDFYLQGDDRIPQTLVFDRNGRLVEKFVGFDQEIKTNLDKAIQTALAVQ